MAESADVPSQRLDSGMATIRRATASDAPRISAMLARAFDDDPFVNFLAKQDSYRQSRILFWASSAVATAVPLGETFVTEDGSGAALWTPPGLAHQPSAWAGWQRLRRIGGPVWAFRLRTILAPLAAQDPTEPHFYLRIVGVEPAKQGLGVGAELLRVVLDRCDREAIPAYLFSTKSRNVSFYEHLGFRQLTRVDIRGGPSLWPMWRDPR